MSNRCNNWVTLHSNGEFAVNLDNVSIINPDGEGGSFLFYNNSDDSYSHVKESLSEILEMINNGGGHEGTD